MHNEVWGCAEILQLFLQLKSHYSLPIIYCSQYACIQNLFKNMQTTEPQFQNENKEKVSIRGQFNTKFSELMS